MRVLMAPGDMRAQPSGTPLVGEGCAGLAAPQVAAALARGWQEARGADVVVQAPVADGGPGSAQVVPSDLVTVREALQGQGPVGQVREVDLLQLAPASGAGPGGGRASGRTWFLDAARLVALPADPAQARQEAREGTTYGLGAVVAQALRRTAPADTLLVGLSRSAVHDGGAGAVAALGGVRGGRALVEGRSLGLVLADGVALGGMDGAGAGLGMTVGVQEWEAQERDRLACRHAADLLRVAQTGRLEGLTVLGDSQPQRLTPTTWGTGAAGGTALVLRALGAWALPGARVMARLTGLERSVRRQDLVVTAAGEVYDLLEDSPVAVVARAAQGRALPVVLVAGRSLLPRGERAGAGVSSVYSLEQPHTDGGGWDAGGEQALRQRLEEMGARLARSWSR
ncbi:glycerate kinase [Actinomyces sp. 2119]|uniref:glycerate kinase n=1 Tax=Actinomyces sp. 2119 TaxID=2321393 RepID=UPI000E6CF34C|nr:glycerate kinase [Actinomyces sp. 2119]RJF44655.1 glycerate kinase [Actinomyces sp. 2119]